MTTLTDRILRAVATSRRTFHEDCEWGAADEPDYITPYWLDLPAERSLLAITDPLVSLPWGHPASEWWPGCNDPVEQCHHGLSAWLCADPVNHYPSDRAW